MTVASLPVRLRLAALVFVLALATILGAWGFQLIGGYMPCPLCLRQRLPYYVGVPLALVALVAAASGRDRLARLALVAVAVVFAVSAGLGMHHAGAEWGFWPGPADCAAGAGAPPSAAGDLLGQMATTRIVSCTEVSWRLLGLSFAGWNAVISLVLVALALAGAAARRRWKSRYR